MSVTFVERESGTNGHSPAKKTVAGSYYEIAAKLDGVIGSNPLLPAQEYEVRPMGRIKVGPAGVGGRMKRKGNAIRSSGSSEEELVRDAVLTDLDTVQTLPSEEAAQTTGGADTANWIGLSGSDNVFGMLESNSKPIIYEPGEKD